MSLNVNDSGKIFGYNANFDLSNATSLEIKFVDPFGLEITIDASRISAPSTDAVFDEKGKDVTYLANEYMQFITNATDFLAHGIWQVTGVYTDLTPDPDQICTGDIVSFTVGKDIFN